MSRNPITTLLGSQIGAAAGARVLVAHVDDVDFLGALASTAAQVDFFHRDWGVLQRVPRLDNLHVSETVFAGDAPGVYDLALIGVPKGRDFARALLFTALHALQPRAMLYAAGPNDGGAKTAQTDLGLLAPAVTRANKARHRLFSALRPVELAAPPAWDAPWQARSRVFSIGDETYTVYTQPGVFSWDHLDDGTARLIATLPALNLPNGQRILDACCGYGILGMVAARTLQPAHLTWADSDLLAVACARLALPGAPILAADLTHDTLPDHAPFDVILCNPPFHREHATETHFMRQFAPLARTMLGPDGRLALVANSFLPYRDLLAGHFGLVPQIDDDGRFQVLLARA